MILPEWYLDLCDRVAMSDMDAAWWMEHEAPQQDGFSFINHNWPFDAAASPQGQEFWSKMLITIGGDMESKTISETKQHQLADASAVQVDSEPAVARKKARISGAERGRIEAEKYSRSMYLSISSWPDRS